jgi:alpha-glucosidase
MGEMKLDASVQAGGGDWWRGCVIYQIYPRSFQDSGEDGVGDLPGITARLPYVASLGVDAIWLSPFFMSPMADMGYDVSDYCAVDPLFGTIEDFDALVAEAHRLGLKVVIDQVLSHSSDQHAWFRESRSSRDNPKADWYVWADPKPDGNPPNNWLSIFGGPAWEWDSTRRQYYLHNFLISQPDLNFHNPDVRRALLETVRFWLDRGVDGFRLDTVNYYFHDAELRSNPARAPGGAGDVPDTNPYGYQIHVYDKNRPENLGFLTEFRALLDEYDDRAAVGEVGEGNGALTIVAAYTGGGDKLHMCYTFDLLAPAFSAEHVANSVREFETAVADGWVCWAFSNHDVQRHATRWAAEGRPMDEVACFAIGLIACLRGSICLYQGEELGLGEADLAFEDLRDPYGIRFWPAFKGRDGCRTPMVWERTTPHGGFSPARPWLPVPPEHLARAVDVQEADDRSILNRYRAILAFRKAHAALSSGAIEVVEQTAEVFAFLREAGGERLLCVFNFAAEPVDWEMPTDLGPIESLAFPHSRTSMDGRSLRLGGLDVFCGRLV